MSYMADRVSSFGTTIFFEMTSLANQHQAVNLGQGFPDFAGPDFIKDAAVQAVQGDINQYAPGIGLANIRAAIASKMERQYGMIVDPQTEITVTHGATEAIFATVMGLVNPGDEVVIFEPFYDSYVPSVQMAHGIPRIYTLRPPNWEIDPDQLEALFSDKTKMVMINTPHNPTGKVFSREELQLIADLCQKYDVIAMADEVYEHIIFDDEQHICIATLDGMADRTVTISSAGKTFSVTGWKTGWVIAKPEINQAAFRSSQFIIYSGVTPMQHAVGVALETADDYYTDLATMYQENRDFLADILAEVGLNPIVPKGTYFMMTDISHLGFADDRAFCRHLTTEVGVAAIPPSAFYINPADGATLARFAFCKTKETLEEAGQRLLKLKAM
ncbi:MAG: methionine aminotransferase [Chloroflexota bacterium]